MAAVLNLIKTMLTEKLSGRCEDLEKRFQREANDLNALETHVKTLKSKDNKFKAASLQDCDNLSKLIEETLAENSKMRNEQILRTSTNSLMKSVDKSRDKSLYKDKSMKNVTQPQPTLTKTRTVANLKKEDPKTPMTKQKSNLNLHIKIDESSTMPKTPKGDKRLQTGWQTPSKGTTKTLLRTPTTRNLQEDREMKRTLTAKSKEKDSIKREIIKEPVKTFEKNSSKYNLTKSNTKGNLLRESATKSNTAKTSPPAEIIKPFEKQSKHPIRSENISQTIGVLGLEHQVADELLTKEDLHEHLIISALEKSELAPPKLDFAEILDDRWSGFAKYLNRFDHVKILSLNKVFGKLSMSSILGDLNKEILDNEAKIKALREKHSKEELNKEQVPFAMTRGAAKAVELLNESLYFKLFDGPQPNEDILLSYRVFFQLLNFPTAAIPSQSEFWAETCKYFAKERDGKLGTMITNLVKSIDFSDENVYKVGKLIGPNLIKISPNYFSKMCGTTGLFIFLIKDALDYAGILVDKKTPPSRHLRNCLYTFQVLQAKMERLKKLQMALFPL